MKKIIIIGIIVISVILSGNGYIFAYDIIDSNDNYIDYTAEYNDLSKKYNSLVNEYNSLLDENNSQIKRNGDLKKTINKEYKQKLKKMRISEAKTLRKDKTAFFQKRYDKLSAEDQKNLLLYILHFKNNKNKVVYTPQQFQSMLNSAMRYDMIPKNYVPIKITVGIGAIIGIAILIWIWIIANKEKDLIQKESEIESLEKKADRTYKQAENAIITYEEKEAKLSIDQKAIEKQKKYIRENINSWRRGINDIQTENVMLSKKYNSIKSALDECYQEIEMMKQYVHRAYKDPAKIASRLYKIDKAMEKIKQEVE